MLIDPELLLLCDPKFVRGGDFTGMLVALGNRSVSGLFGGGPSGGGSGNEGVSSKMKPSAPSCKFCRWCANEDDSPSRGVMGFPKESKLCEIFSNGSSETVGNAEWDC
jgi:hypothetical protein